MAVAFGCNVVSHTVRPCTAKQVRHAAQRCVAHRLHSAVLHNFAGVPPVLHQQLLGKLAAPLVAAALECPAA